MLKCSPAMLVKVMVVQMEISWKSFAPNNSVPYINSYHLSMLNVLIFVGPVRSPINLTIHSLDPLCLQNRVAWVSVSLRVISVVSGKSSILCFAFWQVAVE